MLVLSRQVDQTLMISNDIQITVVQIDADHKAIRVRIEAPPEAFTEMRPERSTARGALLHSTLRVDERLVLYGTICLTLVDIRGNKARIGIEAPPECGVHRKEVWEAIVRENQAASRLVEAPVVMNRLRVKRRPGEGLMIGERIRVTLLSVDGDEARLSIETPKEIPSGAETPPGGAADTQVIALKTETRQSVGSGVVLCIHSIDQDAAELQAEVPFPLSIYRQETWDRLQGT